MMRCARAAAAMVATVALAVSPVSPVAVAAPAAPQSAPPAAQYVRESARLLTEKCEWMVDETGAPIRDQDGKLTPKLENGKQVCTVEVAQGEEIRQTAAKSNKSSRSGKSGDDPAWADEKASSELGVGAVIGIIGAVIAAIVGVFFLFVEDINIRLVPAPAPAPRR